MIPICPAFCLTCRQRYTVMPKYCTNRIQRPGRQLDEQCPGPVIRFLIDEPDLPTLADALADVELELEDVVA